MLLFLLPACLGLDPQASAVRTGAPETDPAADSGETAGDSAETDTMTALPNGSQVCYPGAADDYSACLPLVDWSASWGADYAYPDPYNGNVQYSAPVRFVDLSTTDATLSVAPNFVQSELMSASKGRFGMFQIHAVESIQVIRDASGGSLTVTSAYRNVTYNASVGGVSSSRHLYGDGVDLVSDVWSVDQLAEGCAGAGAAYTQIYTDGHVHCDWRDDGLDPAFYDAVSDTGDTGGPVDTGGTGRRPPPTRAPRPDTDAHITGAGGHLQAPATGFDEGEPLRQWRAYDASGRLLTTAEGLDFALPAGAATVAVRVGGVLDRETRVDGGAPTP